MNKKTGNKQNKKINKKVVFLSIIALICIVFAFIVHWTFIIGAIIIMFINQKELFKKNQNKFIKSKKV
ncbi:hypothetical protein FJZ20_00440 [Candidatus Pacearchaeota archaeon]|nr:hypothetical protein [Candidatus Pacearchaeota archaeon]